MPQVRLFASDMDNIHIWCYCYKPLKMYYPGEKYLHGEITCRGCAIRRGGILYRANFSCKRERTSKPTDDQLKTMFRWMYGKETRRDTKSKVVCKSKKSDDRNEADLWETNRFPKEKSEPEKERISAQTITAKATITDNPTNGLQQLPEKPMWVIAPDVPGTITDSTLQEMWCSGNLQNDKRTLCVLPGVQTMKALSDEALSDEYDPSYETTTMHAVITCSCGRKVWYGCGARQETRPKYCKACTAKEVGKVETMREKMKSDGMSDADFNMLIISATRRYIK